MTWVVAKVLGEKWRPLGARVLFVRDKTEPVTPYRPNDFKETARAVLNAEGIENPPEDFERPDDPLREQSVRWQSEIPFYRTSEIRNGARRRNNGLRPGIG